MTWIAPHRRLVWCEWRSSPARWVAKPLASLGFIALLGHGRKPFLAGLSLILLGHVAYLVADPHRPLDLTPRLRICG